MTDAEIEAAAAFIAHEPSHDTIDRVALAMWRAREQTFTDRLRRPEPDAIDRASGTWRQIRMMAKAALEEMGLADWTVQL